MSHLSYKQKIMILNKQKIDYFLFLQYLFGQSISPNLLIPQIG